MSSVNVHRLIVQVIDWEKYPVDEIIEAIERTDFFTIKVHDIKSRTIDNWSDNHPLNNQNTYKQTFLDLFKGY